MKYEVEYSTTPLFEDAVKVLGEEFCTEQGWDEDTFYDSVTAWEMYHATIQEDVQNLLETEYAELNKPYSRLEGSQVDWTGRSGYKVVDNNDLRDEPLSVVAVADDCTQVWTFEEGHVTIVQSSHDIPTGAVFTLTGADAEE